jgi:hypothetical protein
VAVHSSFTKRCSTQDLFKDPMSADDLSLYVIMDIWYMVYGIWICKDIIGTHFPAPLGPRRMTLAR